MKFAMCNEFCQGWSFDEACELAAREGYQGVEIAPFTLGDSVLEIGPDRRQALRRTAAEYGLNIVGLHWLLAGPDGLRFTCADRSVRARTIDYLLAEVDLCADIGGSSVVFGSPAQRNVRDGQSYQQAWEDALEAFQRLAAHAAGRGVVVCIEPLAPAETNFIQTAAEARRMVQAVGMPAFRMVLDVKAMCSEVRPIPEIIRLSAPYLAHFHANDANLSGPGFGRTDFAPIAIALRDVGYDGWLSVEVFDFSPGPETIARQSLRYLREVFA
jgi:sugar phosphate isomerase/epimerase